MRDGSASPLGIVASDDANVALARILDRELAAIVRLGADVRRAPEGEPLHDFRVAIRRTRSLLSLAKDDLPSDDWASWNREWKWLATLTSDARDLDVVLDDLDATRTVVPSDGKAGVDDLIEVVTARRTAAQGQLRTALTTERFATLTREWRVSLGELALAPRSLENAAHLGRRLVSKAATRVIRQGDRVRGDAQVDAIHDLRKRTKRLRYAIELFGEVLPKSDVQAMVKETKRLQDDLGTFQDNEVERRLLCSLRDTPGALSADAAAATRLLIERCDRRRDTARRSLTKHVRRLVKAAPVFT